MSGPSRHDKSDERKAIDEQIAAEPPMAWPEMSIGANGMPIEALMTARTRLIAVDGVVENGLVRLLDPAVRLPEKSRVIIVAREEAVRGAEHE
jgi:hypothetical protein